MKIFKCWMTAVDNFLSLNNENFNKNNHKEFGYEGRFLVSFDNLPYLELTNRVYFFPN